jgi:hypothetical protein
MRHALVILPVVALIGLGSTAPNAARKCGTPVPSVSQMLKAIDGVMLGTPDSALFAKLKSEDIYSMDFVCMNPLDSTFSKSRGVTVLSIWMKTGPAPRITEALDVVRQAQDSSFAHSRRYIQTGAEIQLPAIMRGISVVIEASADGWVARTTVPRLLKTCEMFDGKVATATAGAPRKSRCTNDY